MVSIVFVICTCLLLFPTVYVCLWTKKNTLLRLEQKIYALRWIFYEKKTTNLSLEIYLWQTHNYHIIYHRAIFQFPIFFRLVENQDHTDFFNLSSSRYLCQSCNFCQLLDFVFVLNTSFSNNQSNRKFCEEKENVINKFAIIVCACAKCDLRSSK